MAVLCEPLRRGEPRCHGDYSVLPCARPAERGLRVVRSFGSDSLDRLVTTASFSSGLRSGRRPRARAAAARVVSFRRADVSFRMPKARSTPPTLSFDFRLRTRRLSSSGNNIIMYDPRPPKGKASRHANSNSTVSAEQLVFRARRSRMRIYLYFPRAPRAPQAVRTGPRVGSGTY